MSDEWVWLRHPDTEGVQYVPPTAAPTWRELGWEPCDPPAEPNPALAEYAPIVAPRQKKPKSDVVETTEKEMSDRA